MYLLKGDKQQSNRSHTVPRLLFTGTGIVCLVAFGKKVLRVGCLLMERQVEPDKDFSDSFAIHLFSFGVTSI